MEDAIQRGDDILLVSHLDFVPSGFANELEYLFNRGYKRIKNRLVKVVE